MWHTVLWSTARWFEVSRKLKGRARERLGACVAGSSRLKVGEKVCIA